MNEQTLQNRKSYKKKLIFELDDKANVKVLLSAQIRRHLRKKERNTNKEKRIIYQRVSFVLGLKIFL